MIKTISKINPWCLILIFFCLLSHQSSNHLVQVQRQSVSFPYASNGRLGLVNVLSLLPFSRTILYTFAIALPIEGIGYTLTLRISWTIKKCKICFNLYWPCHFSCVEIKIYLNKYLLVDIWDCIFLVCLNFRSACCCAQFQINNWWRRLIKWVQIIIVGHEHFDESIGTKVNEKKYAFRNC